MIYQNFNPVQFVSFRIFSGSCAEKIDGMSLLFVPQASAVSRSKAARFHEFLLTKPLVELAICVCWSIVFVFAFSEGISNIEQGFGRLRVEDCTDQINVIVFELKGFCVTQMCATSGTEPIVCIIRRAIVVNQILNFTSASVEDYDIIRKFFLSQLMTIYVPQGNIPIE